MLVWRFGGAYSPVPLSLPLLPPAGLPADRLLHRSSGAHAQHRERLLEDDLGAEVGPHCHAHQMHRSWQGELGVWLGASAVSHVDSPLQRKCEQYWAENIGDTYKSPDKMFSVVTTSVMPFADFVIRTFSVKDVS